MSRTRQQAPRAQQRRAEVVQRPREEPPPRLGRTALFALLACSLVALALRIRCAHGDLWLDEIWSLHWAARAGSFLGVFTNVHVDNNHYLYTAYLRLLDECSPPLLVRLPSVLAGTAAVVLAGLVVRDAGVAAVVAAGVLTAVSPLLVVLSSEARGYALAFLFALLGCLLVERRALSSRGGAWAFGLTMLCGLLAHLTFVQIWIALALASAYCIRDDVPRGMRLRRFAAAHAIPAIGAFLLWAVDLRKLRVAGGGNLTLTDVLGSTASLTLGGPERPRSAGFWIVCAAALFALALMAVRDRRRALVLATAVVIAPAATIIGTEPHILYPRYFALASVFLILALARGFAAAWTHGRSVRVLAVLALAMVAGGNLWHVALFAQHGRGEYRDAIQYMAARSTTPTFTVASDFDFRNETVLNFHARCLGLEHRAVYVRQRAWPHGGPDWILVHLQDETPLSDHETDGDGNVYGDRKDFPYGGISGWQWSLYRNLQRGTK